MLAVPAALCVWTLISPQSVWRRTTAWRHRRPGAVRPNRTGYAVARVCAFVALVLIGVAVGLVLSRHPAEWGQQRREYEDCLARHRVEGVPAEVRCADLSPSPGA